MRQYRMEYKNNLKDLFLFELKSWIGRVFVNNKPKLKNELNYLNLGSGANILDGYINADFFYSFKFWKKDIPKIEWQLDLRYPLHCKDEVFNGIFTEHTLEHLYPDDAAKLLQELYRVLKSGSIIRITVPDIEKYVFFYNNNFENINEQEFKSRFNNGCNGIRNVTQNYFHFSAWDYQELKIFLEDAGFNDIKKMEFGNTQDKNLNLDLEDRSWESLYVEAKKC